MLILSPLFAAVIVVIVGAVIIWSNPVRRINRVAFSCSLNLGAWLLFLHLATTTKEGVNWLRIACAVGGTVPIHFWLVKESVANPAAHWMRDVFSRCAPWVGITAVLCALPFTDVFIPPHSTSETRLFGWGYYTYIVIDLGLYVVLMVDAFRSMKRLTGVRRLELHVWLVGGGAMTTLILATMALNAVTHDRLYIQMQPLIMLIFYAGTVLAISTRRVFDARQIALLLIEKGVLVLLVAAVAYIVEQVAILVFPDPLDYIFTIAITLSIAVKLMEWLDSFFEFYPRATTARQTAFAAAQRERSIEGLKRSFGSVLKGWGQTEEVVLLTIENNSVQGQLGELRCDRAILATMEKLRWVTPERLLRERTTPERDAVSRFLMDHNLAVLVLEVGPAITLVLGVGVGAGRRPYTFPQVMQLMELASIMESALERAHFAAKVQHAEQLATVGLLGASLAHEIRNPLVSIKTFVQLLPTHHNDPAFREKFFRLIGHEVDRIDHLTVQLLELASPRTYSAAIVALHPLLQSSLELVVAKAKEKNVEVHTGFQATPDIVSTDVAAAKQVILNLCLNAIQSLEFTEGERWVRVSTRNTPEGVEMAVADSGPGIAPEIRSRLFLPFQTTKSTGFGLGLAICRDILANLNATITVDAHVPGHGATFRVIFPCQPLSS